MIITYFLLILSAGLIGLKAGALTRTGALTSVLVGIAVAFGFGWRGLLLLGVFFASSTIWSKYKVKQKQHVEQIVVKGAARDHHQVLANGGAAAFAGIMMAIFPSTWWLVFFISVLAASNADTWASELGVLSKRPPFHIMKFDVVPRGTSGAVSILGMLASLFGAFLIGGVGYFLFETTFIILLATTVAGFFGSVFDTILGALAQEEFYCEKCSIKTEHHEHCGSRTKKIKGISGLNNDFVNLIASVCGGIAGGVWFL